MQLLTKQGKLTRYAMACGYIEKTETPTHFINLMMDGSVIMVRTYNRETGSKGQASCRTARDGYRVCIDPKLPSLSIEFAWETIARALNNGRKLRA